MAASLLRGEVPRDKLKECAFLYEHIHSMPLEQRVFMVTEGIKRIRLKKVQGRHPAKGALKVRVGDDVYAAEGSPKRLRVDFKRERDSHLEENESPMRRQHLTAGEEHHTSPKGAIRAAVSKSASPLDIDQPGKVRRTSRATQKHPILRDEEDDDDESTDNQSEGLPERPKRLTRRSSSEQLVVYNPAIFSIMSLPNEEYNNFI